MNSKINVDQKVKWGSSIKILSSKELSDFYIIPNGKRFIGWNTNVKGSGYTMLPNANWTVYEDTEIYPIFE